MILVALALIGGIVLLIAGGGDTSSGTRPRAADLRARYLKRTVAVPAKGISVRRPDDWTDTRRAGIVTLRSGDHCLAMTLSAPVPADRAKGLRSDSLALLSRTYRGARVGAAPDAQVGGIPTSSNAISFTDSKGTPIRVLLSVGTGETYAYLTEIVVRDPSCQADLALGQLVLSSIQYTE